MNQLVNRFNSSLIKTVSSSLTNSLNEPKHWFTQKCHNCVLLCVLILLGIKLKIK